MDNAPRALVRRFLYAVFGIRTDGLIGQENALFITLTPAHPAPGQVVTLSAQSSYADLTKSVLTWRVDGKVVAEGTGLTIRR